MSGGPAMTLVVTATPRIPASSSVVTSEQTPAAGPAAARRLARDARHRRGRGRRRRLGCAAGRRARWRRLASRRGRRRAAATAAHHDDQPQADREQNTVPVAHGSPDARSGRARHHARARGVPQPPHGRVRRHRPVAPHRRRRLHGILSLDAVRRVDPRPGRPDAAGPDPPAHPRPHPASIASRSCWPSWRCSTRADRSRTGSGCR